MIKVPPIISIREKRRLALYRAIVKRLREQPELWAIPMENLDRWDKLNGPRNNTSLWREILTTMSREDIIKMLLSRSERGDMWRKSSPFVGIITQEERNRIFERYRHVDARGKIPISCRLSDIAREHGIAGEMTDIELIDRLLELGATKAAKQVHDLIQRAEKITASKFRL